MTKPQTPNSTPDTEVNPQSENQAPEHADDPLTAALRAMIVNGLPETPPIDEEVAQRFRGE
jgi:hypothetical protein